MGEENIWERKTFGEEIIWGSKSFGGPGQPARPPLEAAAYAALEAEVWGKNLGEKIIWARKSFGVVNHLGEDNIWMK